MQFIDDEIIRATLEAARRSPRRRMNYNFHTGPGDNPHRFLNVLLQDTYVAPHRHLVPPKAESFLVLEGSIVLICFDDDGSVRSRHWLGDRAPATARGIDLEPGVWHTLTAVTPYAVCYEVKPGPWDPATDKEFAPWAPREGDPRAEAYLRELLNQDSGNRANVIRS
jgi:cupin fold WbuC family metalloprotein